MKRLSALFLLSVVLCSCSDVLTEQEKKEKLVYTLTPENYGLFFKVEHDRPNQKTKITPNYNKHINYQNVVFAFKNNYTIMSSKMGTYDFSINVDETGNGQASNIDITSYTTSTDYQFVSVEGVVSFDDNYTTFEEIGKTKKPFQKESIGVYYDFYGSTRYYLEFKVDSSVTETPDTDAFYLIESVKVKFTAMVNNSTKECEFDLRPSFCGVAQIPTDDEYKNITNKTYSYTNAFYVAY